VPPIPIEPVDPFNQNRCDQPGNVFMSGCGINTWDPPKTRTWWWWGGGR
jgi:hypothetical protein